MSAFDLAWALAGTAGVFTFAAYFLFMSTIGYMEPAARRFRGRAAGSAIAIALAFLLAAIWVGATS